MARKDHPHAKNDDKYEALRDKGMNKERAAKISNSKGSSKVEVNIPIVADERVSNVRNW